MQQLKLMDILENEFRIISISIQNNLIENKSLNRELEILEVKIENYTN